MSEMLANQYFMVRRFRDAETVFENVLSLNKEHKPARKKLILCYIHNGRIKNALSLFRELISEDIKVIVDTDLIADDCPCPDLISKFAQFNEPEVSFISKNEMLGMLWLYCDIHKSIEFFEKLHEYNPADEDYKAILKIYNNYLSTPH